MIASSLVIVLIGLGWAATALFGKRGPQLGLAANCALALPFIAISCGVGLAFGMGLVGALIASVSVLLALLIPTVLPSVRARLMLYMRASWLCQIA